MCKGNIHIFIKHTTSHLNDNSGEAKNKYLRNRFGEYKEKFKQMIFRFITYYYEVVQLIGGLHISSSSFVGTIDNKALEKNQYS